jgi:hypothetical protein
MTTASASGEVSTIRVGDKPVHGAPQADLASLIGTAARKHLQLAGV